MLDENHGVVTSRVGGRVKDLKGNSCKIVEILKDHDFPVRVLIDCNGKRKVEHVLSLYAITDISGADGRF